MMVLIVDDDEVFGDLLVDWLSAAGYQPSFQHGPFGTVNRIRREKPGLLILDINMPAITGPEVFRLLRETPGLEHVKVLLMSSMDARELERLRRELGADAALPKSATRAVFLETVRALSS